MKQATLNEGLISLSSAFPSFKLSNPVCEAWFKKFRDTSDNDFILAINTVIDTTSELPYGVNMMRLVNETLKANKKANDLFLDNERGMGYTDLTDEQRNENIAKVGELIDRLSKGMKE